MVALTVVVNILVLLLLAAGGVATWYCRPPRTVDRMAAAGNEALLAEARIDQLTRQTVQQMRDVVRDDMRRRHRGDVTDGDIIE